AHDRNRPLLQVDNPRAIIEELLADRDPLYREVADLVIMTERRKPQLVAEDIVTEVRHLMS
ncbi:MAG: shikimate kinase, partial [Porticoccus sp.]